METTTFRPLFDIDSESAKGQASFRKEVLNDYYICCVSRAASLLARKEVLTGKAKFGVTGDGKEVAQIALAKALKKGDFRSGYYRDQTLMFAMGVSSVEDYFAQMYSDTRNDPFSGGRQMMCHFASKLVDKKGQWTKHVDQFNSSADLSSTAGQMGRATGLAMASRKYRRCENLEDPDLSKNGDEVVVCTIGDGSTSEGTFWENINCAAVTKIPIAFCVWDDGYAISVPTKYQTVKGSISKALKGFVLDKNGRGIRMYTAKAWDYPSLCDMFAQGIKKIRKTHVPALFHVQDATQPQGHSTSGSQERYKPRERLLWERDVDCNEVFRSWIIENDIASQETVDSIKTKAREYARDCKDRAWKRFVEPNKASRADLLKAMRSYKGREVFNDLIQKVARLHFPLRSELLVFARQAKYKLEVYQLIENQSLRNWIIETEQFLHEGYGTHLLARDQGSALSVPIVAPAYQADSPVINGFEILNKFFHKAFKANDKLFAFGEDVGYLGDVNQGMMGLQKAFGEERVYDTGIREWSIVGQAIGMAMRGLRPIAEIQYLDYLVYGMAPLIDDLATLRYRSAGIQRAPAIIRTRGHRLEGIWHSGSPLGMIVNSFRGIHVLVPRNMVQAAGMYQTMLNSTDPALMIECLNGYRLKEKLPSNLGEFTVPLGVPEVLIEGTDLTLVTYGSCVRIAQRAIERLEKLGMSVELIDVQTLLPFDLNGLILKSLIKTNRILFLDEDVPGGATAYMMQQVLEVQGGFDYCEIKPKSLTAKDHRPPYGSDGDYYSKPNVEDVFEAAYQIMRELDPKHYSIY